jgi:hypothetical protein
MTLTIDSLQYLEENIYAIFKDNKLITTIQYNSKDSIFTVGSDKSYDYKEIADIYKGLEYTIIPASNVVYGKYIQDEEF